ncbi:MAG TPA: hypothetical protein VKU87_12585 [Thermomicrobiaceae bacterium]|nr:hypothetical protein [Thermomicrobiaceae bacterium]
MRSTARDAWQSEQEQRRRAREEFRQARDGYEGAILRQLMERRLGVQVFPRYPEVTVDGLRFALRWHSEAEAYELTLLTTCPGCGSIISSGDILHLADLGSVLDDVAAGRNRCPDCQVRRESTVAGDVDEPDRVIDGTEMTINRTGHSNIDVVRQHQTTASSGETIQIAPLIPGGKG